MQQQEGGESENRGGKKSNSKCPGHQIKKSDCKNRQTNCANIKNNLTIHAFTEPELCSIYAWIFFFFHFLAKFEHTVALIKVFFSPLFVRVSLVAIPPIFFFFLGHLEMKVLWGCNADMAS